MAKDSNKGAVSQHKRMAMGEAVTGMKKGGKVKPGAKKGAKKSDKC